MQTDKLDEINRYCSMYSSHEPAFLKELVRFTWLHTTNPRQLSGHLQGRFLAFLSKIIRPDCILEIGTFTGYATFCLAEGLSTNGQIHSFEADLENVHKAKSQAKKSEFAHKIVFHPGDAKTLLPEWDTKADLIFVDAEKQNYAEYLSLCLPILSERGILLFDNTLWSGKVAEVTLREKDTDTRNMHQFNQHLSENKDLEVVLLPLRDGLTLVRKK